VVIVAARVQTGMRHSGGVRVECTRCGEAKGLCAFAVLGKWKRDCICKVCRRDMADPAGAQSREAKRLEHRRAWRRRAGKTQRSWVEWVAEMHVRAQTGAALEREIAAAIAARSGEHTEMTCGRYEECLDEACEVGGKCVPCVGCARWEPSRWRMVLCGEGALGAVMGEDDGDECRAA